MVDSLAHHAGAYPPSSMKLLGVFLLPPGWDASPLQGLNPSSKFASTHAFTPGWRGTMRVKCLVQERNTGPQPVLEPDCSIWSPAH